jgi:hypothetical protein
VACFQLKERLSGPLQRSQGVNAGALVSAVKDLKQLAMTTMNEYLAAHEKGAAAQEKEPEAVDIDEEEDIEIEEDEIQKIAGGGAHKRKKRKTGM